MCRHACSIALEAEVVVTGGWHAATRSLATRYNTTGYTGGLPSLGRGRYQHGCGHYVDTRNQIVGI